MKTLAALFGKAILTIVAMALITSASLFVVGAYLATWPILRQAPRTRRKRAVMEALVAVMGVFQAFAPDTDASMTMAAAAAEALAGSADSRPSPPKSDPLP